MICSTGPQGQEQGQETRGNRGREGKPAGTCRGTLTLPEVTMGLTESWSLVKMRGSYNEDTTLEDAAVTATLTQP